MRIILCIGFLGNAVNMLKLKMHIFIYYFKHVFHSHWITRKFKINEMPKEYVEIKWKPSYFFWEKDMNKWVSLWFFLFLWSNLCSNLIALWAKSIYASFAACLHFLCLCSMPAISFNILQATLCMLFIFSMFPNFLIFIACLFHFSFINFSLIYF